MEISPIAIIDGCYPEKFGVPRQPRLVTSATAWVRLVPPYRSMDFIDGLLQFSHIWLVFGFHQNEWQGDAKVRPQRLGGNQKMGVLATRSPYRPNGLGLSAVEIVKIDADEVAIEIAGHDLINGTPIYDIKPYIPFTDAILTASTTFAPAPPMVYEVKIHDDIAEKFASLPVATQDFIKDVISQNPRPVYHKKTDRIYGVSLGQWNVRFRWVEDHPEICGIEPLSTP
ncbi:tRNA (N6-threonylcarbamoyladenosine(37)-N6)-methyltransferase TrmO [Wohlfahrtiimonas chitiniclastica]|uniref:tRNA (N6-threonylcarbamoyladenosine(37)-N6)-methyltransferase TrmO n=1 Tax=Wohlfahrtiimonas chitiniclastica TaxID=400946 RepID=UPI000B9992DA|nr:tRNA (N6-threonylcarbamoyladenosine(37)-N6)-methyltransferase TrmO [Wohlfahrtiimonas chitiniclastica]OYQ80409.1 tRNA (N6-threonylcarbamoyladenosine(37)-N6)-methyltransferase TrmO [Wohlfahrtiimonas chitiniclastica]